MIKKLCKFSGCNNYALENKSYCKEHYNPSKPFSKAVRSNENLYQSSRWRNLRKSHLEKYDYCVMCGSRNDLTVDHINTPRGNEDLFFSTENLQTLCKSCHRFKTALEINSVEVFGDILSLASASNNTQAVAIVQRLVASDIFVNNLSAQKILFQHFVASVSSENPTLGDMMIYMGKNPKNNTAASGYQFSISKYIGKLGKQEMWKDMLTTKILASGLLSLMITGCVDVSDDVKIANNSSFVDTGFYEIQQEKDAGSYIRTMNVFNNQYFCISTSGSIFLSKDLNSDFTYNDTLKKAAGAQNFISACIVGGKMYCLTKTKLLSSSDLLNWDTLLETNEIILSGSYWKNKNKYVIHAEDNTDETLYIFDFDSQTFNTLKTSCIYTFLISDDYVFLYDLEEMIFYITDGNTLTPIDLSIPYANIGYIPFELLASYNNKFYITALSKNQPSTGFNYDFYEISYDDGNFKATLLFQEKTFYFRIQYSTHKVLTPYGIVVNYNKFLYLLDWNGDITDISPDSTKENTLTYFYYTEGFAYFIKAYSGTVYVSENLKEWKTLTVPLNSAHNNPYIYGVFFINNLQLFLTVGTSSSKYIVDIFKMEKVSVGESLKSLQERPCIQSADFNTNGYVQWSNGFLIQWGRCASNETTSDSYKTIYFPIAYSKIFTAVATGRPSSQWDGHALGISEFTNTYFKTSEKYNNYCSWIAIGLA